MILFSTLLLIVKGRCSMAGGISIKRAVVLVDGTEVGERDVVQRWPGIGEFVEGDVR